MENEKQDSSLLDFSSNGTNIKMWTLTHKELVGPSKGAVGERTELDWFNVILDAKIQEKRKKK